MTSPLRADTYIAPVIPVKTQTPPPSSVPSTWSPTTSTLISGPTEAILVDPLLTQQQASELAAWTKSIIPDKTLTTVFITHGHADHFLALGAFLKHFPSARAVATAKVYEQCQAQMSDGYFNAVWNPMFPDQLDRPVGLISPLDSSNEIKIDGHTLHAIDAGQSDTGDTSFLHVPSLNMVVAGDIVYNELHQWFGEANTTEKRNEWKAACNQIAALRPETIIAGHKRQGAVDGFNNIAATKAYIDAFEECVGESKDKEELFENMMKRYPTRVNPLILWLGCAAQSFA